MRIDYPDGSFMLSWDRCRAWYAADGTLKDCEYKRRYRGSPIAVAVPARHHKVRAWLERQGRMEFRMLAARHPERRIDV